MAFTGDYSGLHLRLTLQRCSFALKPVPLQQENTFFTLGLSPSEKPEAQLLPAFEYLFPLLRHLDLATCSENQAA
jgi:hypothetical protein